MQAAFGSSEALTSKPPTKSHGNIFLRGPMKLFAWSIVLQALMSAEGVQALHYQSIRFENKSGAKCGNDAASRAPMNKLNLPQLRRLKRFSEEGKGD